MKIFLRLIGKLTGVLLGIVALTVGYNGPQDGLIFYHAVLALAAFTFATIAIVFSKEKNLINEALAVAHKKTDDSDSTNVERVFITAKAHNCFNVVALACIVPAFAAIYQYHEHEEHPQHFLSAHGQMGAAIFGFGWVMVIFPVMVLWSYPLPFYNVLGIRSLLRKVGGNVKNVAWIHKWCGKVFYTVVAIQISTGWWKVGGHSDRDGLVEGVELSFHPIEDRHEDILLASTSQEIHPGASSPGSLPWDPPCT